MFFFVQNVFCSLGRGIVLRRICSMIMESLCHDWAQTSNLLVRNWACLQLIFWTQVLLKWCKHIQLFMISIYQSPPMKWLGRYLRQIDKYIEIAFCETNWKSWWGASLHCKPHLPDYSLSWWYWFKTAAQWLHYKY